MARCTLVKCNAFWYMVKSDEFENLSHLIYFSQILLKLLFALMNASNERCLEKKSLLANLLQRAVVPSNLRFLAGNRFCTKFYPSISYLTYHLQIKWWWIFLGFLRRKTKMSCSSSLRTDGLCFSLVICDFLRIKQIQVVLQVLVVVFNIIWPTHLKT